MPAWAWENSTARATTIDKTPSRSRVEPTARPTARNASNCANVSLQLPQRVTEQRQGPRHRADLVPAGRGYLDVDVAGVEALHRRRQTAQRHDDRAQDQQREQNAEDDRGRDDNSRKPGGRFGLRDDALTCGDRGAGQFLYDRRDELVGIEAVLSSLRQQRVSDYPAVICVFIDRLFGQILRIAATSLWTAAIRCGFHGGSLSRCCSIRARAAFAFRSDIVS